MPIWITALGVAGLGAFYGYLAFYALKRYFLPTGKQPMRVKDLVLFLTALGLSGAIGAPFVSLDGISYVGPYGLGLLAGLLANLAVTVAVGMVIYRHRQRADE